MMSQRLPQQLSYQKIVPKGFPSVFKQWINDPLTGNKVWANNDIVRFNFLNSKRGVFDPYRSYLQITVSVSPNDLPVGLLQVDNSAHSFINQLVLYSENRQIQRITQYGVLLAYLNDIGLNEFLSEGRQTQGLGYGSFDTTPLNKGLNSANSQPRRCNTASDLTLCVGTGNVFPTIGNGYPQQVQYQNMNSLYNCSRSSKGHITNANPIMTNTDWNGGNGGNSSISALSACMNISGFAQNIRSEYLTNFISNKYPQSTQSIPNYELLLDKAVSGGNYPFKFNNKTYTTTVRQSYTDYLYYSHAYNQNTHYINTANFGFTSLFAPFHTRGCFQPFISPSVPQCMMSDGSISRTKFPIYRRKFKVPIASAIMGALVDSNNYVLIPLQSINGVYMQITLDPFAMFTSGYNDVSEFDDIGMNLQQKRCYQIERLQYKLHTYFFASPEIQQYIRASLYKQIVIVANMWSLGNQYQVGSGTPVNNSYIVGCSSLNLNEMVCLFVSNQYQKYSFCRKHFRLSNNIRRFWSKLGVQYWPPQPFKGNGGNPASNNLQDDNSIFIQNIYWANNYMFTRNILPRINIYNFAVNQRPYDTSNKNTFYDSAMYNNQNYAFNSKSVNADTAMGMAYIHQNRVIGKAAYINVFTPFSNQQNLLQGINVSGLSNFEAVFETQSGNTATCDQTLYIYCKSSVIVKYTSQGIKVYGR